MRLTILVLLFFPLTNNAQQLAFPCVTGGGSYVTGGRGGQVIKVTNLDDDGPGSFREALLTTGPRIVVFDVSGTITLNTILELGIDNSNLTIAGQTAPEGGITIAGRPVQLGGGYNIVSQACNNVVIRYIRFRNSSFTGIPDVYLHNGLISTGTDGLVIDHCSFSFCDDQAISMNPDYGPLTNITIQNSIFSENATGIVIGANLNDLVGDITTIHNLFVDQSHRTPNVGGTLQFDILNNVFFNWKPRLVNINRGSPKVNFIGNYHQVGDFTFTGIANKVQDIIPQGIYTANNFHTTLYPNPQLEDLNLWTDFFSQELLPESYFTSTPFPFLGNIPEIEDANDAYQTVTSDVGANKSLDEFGNSVVYIDSFDGLKISNTLNNISSDPENKNWTLPNLPTNTRPADYDTNNDGMPDEWKIAQGYGINADLSDLVWESGYIGVEAFLNEIDDCPNPTLSITNSDHEEFNIFPNPAKNFVTIISTSNSFKLDIFEITGRKIFTKIISENRISIPLNQLKNGIYLIRLTDIDRRKIITHKLIVKK